MISKAVYFQLVHCFLPLIALFAAVCLLAHVRIASLAKYIIYKWDLTQYLCKYFTLARFIRGDSSQKLFNEYL